MSIYKTIFLFSSLFVLTIFYAQEVESKSSYTQYINEQDDFFTQKFITGNMSSEDLKSYKKYQRMRWYSDNRIGHNGNFEEYMSSLMDLSKNGTSQYFGSEALLDSWVNVDPASFPTGSNIGNMGKGQIRSIWVNPSDSNHLLIGTFGGGIHESKNALAPASEVRWELLTREIPAHTIYKIEVHNGIIYAAAGFDYRGINFSNALLFSNLPGMGVIRSSDGGKNWEFSDFNSNELPNGFNCVDFQWLTNDKMYAIDYHGFYLSLNGGKEWKRKVNFLDQGFPLRFKLNTIFVNPNDSNKIWLGSIEVNHDSDGVYHIYHSSDGGKSWIDRFPEFASQIELKNWKEKDYLEFSSETIDGKTIHFLYHHSQSRKVYYFQEVDGEITFLNNFEQKPHQGTISSITQLKHLTKGATYLIGMPYMSKIDFQENGKYMYNTSGKLHADIRAIAFGTSPDGNYLFTGTDGGINRTLMSPGGMLENGNEENNRWEDITNNLNAFLTISMGYYSDNHRRLYDIGTQDCGWYRNEMEGQPMNFTKTWEGGAYTSPSDPNKTYFIGKFNHPTSVSDTVPSLGYAKLKKLPRNNKTFSAPIMEDPLEPNRLYRTYVLRDNDRFTISDHYGKEESHDDLRASVHISKIYQPIDQFRYSEITNFDVAWNGNNFILSSYYLSNRSEKDEAKNILRYSHDGGVSFKKVDIPQIDNIKIQSFRCTDVDIHDYEPNRIWACFGNVKKDIKVFESTDFGNTWKNISYNLPNLPVNRIEFDENRNRLLIGTDYGVQYFDTPSNSWKELGENLPKSIVTSLYIDDLYDKVIVSTFGSGTWELDLEDCSDYLIQENETWNEDKKICGDIIVRPNKTLQINNAHITAQNIVLMKGARLIWNGGELHSTKNSHSYLIIGNESSVEMKNITLYDYTINRFGSGMFRKKGKLKKIRSRVN